MKLTSAARHFDRLPMVDAYNPVSGVSFVGQFDLFDDSKRDGSTVQRRIISLAPNVVLPARGAVQSQGQVWMLGLGEPDYFRDKIIRIKYVAHKADELAAFKSFDQAIAGSAGTNVYASRSWVKSSKEIDISSEEVNVFDIFVDENETPPDLVFLSGRWHIVRSSYPSAAGFLVLVVDELPEPVAVSATFQRRIYQPIGDTYSETPLTINALRIRWQSHFRYAMKGVETYKPGDVVLMVLKADLAVPAQGDKVTVNGEDYAIHATLDDGLCWSLHLTNV